MCKLASPFVNSHHDVILTECKIPSAPLPPPEQDLVKAPRVANDRIKIIWDEEGIENYETLVGSSLAGLRERWGNSSSLSSISLLLSSTYSFLSFAARSTNKSIELSTTRTKKPRVCPDIRRKEKFVLRCKKSLDKCIRTSLTPELLEGARDNLRTAKASLRQAVRSAESELRNKRDEDLFNILSKDPSAAHRAIKSAKNVTATEIQNLKVNDKVYTGVDVPDGFYDSLSSLKAPDMSPLYSSPHFQETLLDFENVLKIAREGSRIPAISPKQSTELVLSLKANVNDFYSITALHFINAGFEGLEHFHFLLNIIIDEINLSSLEELNTIWACILYKGHRKDKESDRSYRTISTCPLLAKALDSYVGSLYQDGWADAQAETQFQGSGSSHELAALLLTESVNFSLYSAKKPIYILLLDAKSAFDLMPRESIIVNAYKAGTCDQGLTYLIVYFKPLLVGVGWKEG